MTPAPLDIYQGCQVECLATLKGQFYPIPMT